MSRASSRAANTPAPAAAPEGVADASETIVHLSLRDHPFVVAALALASAMATVAKFPNTPVPESLVARLDTAQAALVTAAGDIDQGFFSPELEQLIGEPIVPLEYDDAWIKDTFEALNGALKERFEAASLAQKQRESDAAADLNERIARIETAIAALTPVTAPADPA